MKAYFQITVTKPDGTIIKRTRKLLSRSFVQQYIQILAIQMRQAAFYIKDTGAIIVNQTPNILNFHTTAPLGNVARGIIVGTSTTPVTNEDFKLIATIYPGITAGKLSYGVQLFLDPITVNGNVDFQLVRSLQNQSGTSIAINEIGIYSSTDYNSYCLVRDVLAAPITVANGNTVTISYTLRTTA